MSRRSACAGCSAVLSPATLGHGLRAFVEAKLDRTSSEVFDAFAAPIRQVADVEVCHMVAGGFDDLSTRHRDMAACRIFLSGRLLDLPSVRAMRTCAVMEAGIEGAPMVLE